MNRRTYPETNPVSLMPAPEIRPSVPEWNIRDYVDILWRRKAVFLQVFVILFGMGMVALMRSKPIYEARAKVVVTAGSNSVNLLDPSNPFALLQAISQPDNVDTQLQVLQSEPFLAEAQQRAGIVPKAGIVPPSVKAEATEGTNVIQITVEGGDPKDVARLANAIVDLHRERTDLLHTSGIETTIRLLQSEKERTVQRLAEIDRSLLQFRKAHPGVDIGARKDEQTGEYAALLARVIEGQSNISTTQQQLARLRAQLAREPLELVQETTRDNPRIAKIQDRLDDLDFKRTDLLREYRPSSRQILDLDAERAQLQQRLAREPEEIRIRTHVPNPTRAMLQTHIEELETNLETAQESQNAAQAQYRAQKELLDSLAPSEAKLNQLTHDRDAMQASLTYFSDHLRDLEIRKGAQVPMVRTIERAFVPTAPIGSGKSKNIFVSLVLALIIATGTVFLQEFMDDRVNSPAEVESVYQLPTLAHVPFVEANQSRLIAALPPRSLAAEAYRTLRTSIAFAGFDAPIRRLQITSAAKGEGKSTVSMNLAISMAQDGKKVILVDADLRAPMQHHLLRCEKSPGLSEVLVGMSSIEEALRATDTENLKVLLAGASTPNPAELLGSAAFDQLIEQLDARADVVIYDTPPCLPLSDPLIVAARMDGVVMVLQSGQSRKAGLRQMIEMLGRARARIVGVVFNKEPVTKRGHYYYRHYHDYGYGQYAQVALREEQYRRNGKSLPSATEVEKALSAHPRPTDESHEA